MRYESAFLSCAGSIFTTCGVVSRVTLEQRWPLVKSLEPFAPDQQDLRRSYWEEIRKMMENTTGGMCALPNPFAEGSMVYRRAASPKGPLTVFGYDYFSDHAKSADLVTPKLLGYEGLWGAGEEYAYEALNFVDGKRNIQQIRDDLSAEYGPVPIDHVVEYLRDLEKIGILQQVK